MLIMLDETLGLHIEQDDFVSVGGRTFEPCLFVTLRRYSASNDDHDPDHWNTWGLVEHITLRADVFPAELAALVERHWGGPLPTIKGREQIL